MNTLKDTLNDMAQDVLSIVEGVGDFHPNYEKLEPILEEYLQRIINELNIIKYLK